MRARVFIAAVIAVMISALPAYSESIYDTEPSFSPYSAGSVKASVLSSALEELNYIRGLIGVPAVTLNAEYTRKAQHGAVLLDAINTLTHTPEKPSDMSESFYSLGYDATTHGNLSWVSAGMTLSMSTKLYMEDSDKTNISALGHRRWLMNPRMRQTGFGISTRRGYAVTYVISDSDSEHWPVSLEYITWPVNGKPHPLEYFSKPSAWSVTLNKDIFDKCNDYSVTVKLTRESDGKTWFFGKAGSNGYFNINHEGYAYDECVIFRPEDTGSYSGAWRVEVSGLTRKDGKAGDISYSVSFTGTSQDDGQNTGNDDSESGCNVSGLGFFALMVLGILHVKFLRDGE